MVLEASGPPVLDLEGPNSLSKVLKEFIFTVSSRPRADVLGFVVLGSLSLFLNQFSQNNGFSEVCPTCFTAFASNFTKQWIQWTGTPDSDLIRLLS